MIQIDYHEMLILIEACWSGGTILRASVMQKAVDIWWGLLTPTQRNGVYSYAIRNLQDKGAVMRMDLEIQAIFLARYDPNNQYEITHNDRGGTATIQAFKWNEEYYINRTTHIIPSAIKTVNQIIL